MALSREDLYGKPSIAIEGVAGPRPDPFLIEATWMSFGQGQPKPALRVSKSLQRLERKSLARAARKIASRSECFLLDRDLAINMKGAASVQTIRIFRKFKMLEPIGHNAKKLVRL